MNKKGAPFKYDDDDLKKVLLSVVAKYPGRKINPSFLEHETGIKKTCLV